MTANPQRGDTPLQTHQRFSHDDTDLALRCRGEVGKQALEDVLPGFALRVNADGHHGWGTLLSLRAADWRDRGFAVSVPHGRGYRSSMQKKKKKRERKKNKMENSSVGSNTDKRDRLSHRQISQYRITETFPNMDIKFPTC